MDAASINGSVKTLQCHLLGGNQKWEYDEQVSGKLDFCYTEKEIHKMFVYIR